MKNFIRMTAIALCLVVLMSTLGSCRKQTEEGLVTVRVSLHSNEGSALGGIAVARDFFRQEGIDADITVVESGPVQMAAMRADNPSLDVGFIGAGVAWNPLDPSGNQLSFIFLDNLSDSEMFMANTSIGIDQSSSRDQLFNALRGQAVHMEVGTTPGGWFKEFLSMLNAGRPASEQLWIDSETAAYLQGYDAPNNNPAFRVEVINTPNANLPAGMSSTGADRILLAVGFAPITTTIVRTNSDVVRVASTGTHMPDRYFPSTWVARTRWLDENPDVAQRLVNALVRASFYRGANEAQAEETMRAMERLIGRPDGSLSTASLVMPTREELRDWFSSPSSRGYDYMRALYNARVVNVPAGSTPKTLEQAMRFEFFTRALQEIN